MQETTRNKIKLFHVHFTATFLHYTTKLLFTCAILTGSTTLLHFVPYGILRIIVLCKTCNTEHKHLN